MAWEQITPYCLQNGTNTISKVKIGDKTIYELWYNNKQYTPFNTAQDAMDAFDELEAEKRLEIISRNGSTGEHYE